MSAKTELLPTHYTHLIEVHDDEEGEGPYLAFWPIVGIRLNLDAEDDCTAYIVELDGRHRPTNGPSIPAYMLYDSVHETVSYVQEVFKYSYDECLKRLGGAQ